MKNNIIKKDGRLSCTKFKSCGGCSYKESYPEQLERKQGAIAHKLSRFGKVSKIIPCKEPYRYRCKVTRVYKRAQNGRLIAGIFKSKSGDCVPVHDCMLEDKRLCEIGFKLAEVFERLKLTPYDYNTRKGCLRHIMLRKGCKTGEILLCVVTAPKSLKAPKALGRMIEDKFPDITTIVHNECSNPMPLTLGERESVLKGRGYIEDELLGLRFKISARSFMQVNPKQTEILYSFARDMLGEGTGTLLDAYCGTGTIGLICADRAKSVLGFEKVSSAVENARQNAKDNGIENAEFVCRDAGGLLCELAQSKKIIDAVIMDPPRAGADRRFIESLISLAPQRVIYISCSPESLSRDLYLLKKGGYKAVKIQPVDMFAHTRHLECVCLLEKRVEKE